MLDIIRRDTAARNQLRSEAGLPVLSVAEEFRRAYGQRQRGHFETFLIHSDLRMRIEKKIIAHIAVAWEIRPGYRPARMSTT